MKPKQKRKSPRKKIKLDALARRNKRFKADIRTAFVNCGFTHIPTRDHEFTFNNATTDFDAIYCCENLIVVVEDTTERDPAAHLRKKTETWKRMTPKTEEFVSALEVSFERFAEFLGEGSYEAHDYLVRFLYVSLSGVSDEHAHLHRDFVHFLDNSRLQYFVSLSKTISRSALYELLCFLNVALSEFGLSNSGTELKKYAALYLPETPSGFTKGHKVVSLLMDPETLLERSYVLRADGWKDSDALYQRLLVKNKIKEMRQYLKAEKRVFVNNVIVTFPHDTVLFEVGKQQPLDASINRTKITPVDIELPRRFNSIGIIDGQHRIFAYHQGIDDLEGYIGTLRRKQHLLVTGIIYPRDVSTAVAQQFEAKLFLEINDKQKRVRGDLKQAIERIVRPRSAVAVAKAVVDDLASTSPFVGFLETHAFDVGKLKTTSIVSYGLKYVVDPSRPDSLMALWADPIKASFETDDLALKGYTAFCSGIFREFFNAFKSHVGDQLWTNDRVVSRVLNATTINGLVFVMRRLVQNQKILKYQEYRSRFQKLTVSFDPKKYRFKSSHWKDMGEQIINECFSDLVESES